MVWEPHGALMWDLYAVAPWEGVRTAGDTAQGDPAVEVLLFVIAGVTRGPVDSEGLQFMGAGKISLGARPRHHHASTVAVASSDRVT